MTEGGVSVGLNPRHRNVTRSPGDGGQVLVLVAAALTFMLGVVGIVIDGGYAFAQQRGSQNGADAAATAGALVLAQNLPFRALGQTLPKADSDVAAEVSKIAGDNGLASIDAYYTDQAGNLLRPDGSLATGTSDAAQVGITTIPPGTWGVNAVATKAFNTFFARVLGLTTITATTTATSVSGYVENAGAGNVLPVTIPLNMITCDNNGDFLTIQPPTWWPENGDQEVILPLCKGSASGNVGWLDWSPPGGGTQELEQAILHPSNPAIPVPSWQYVTQTGNINSSQIEDALNTYAGRVVLIPFFDNACETANTAANSECPVGSGPGTGQNNWYHMPLFFGFEMRASKAAFITGSNPECGLNWNGAGCLIGKIGSYVGPNVTVGVGTGTELDAYSALGVQLIR